MNMTRKRSPRKKRLGHGCYFTFDLWTSMVTVTVTLMITGSCAVDNSYQNMTQFTNETSREQSVTEIQETVSHEKYTDIVTEQVDNVNKQNSNNDTYNVVLDVKPNITHIPHVIISNLTLGQTENTTTVSTTSYDNVTSDMNMKDKREYAIDGSTTDYYEVTTNIIDSTESAIDKSINLNEQLRNTHVNNYTDESIFMTQNISKDSLCPTGEQKVDSCLKENTQRINETSNFHNNETQSNDFYTISSQETSLTENNLNSTKSELSDINVTRTTSLNEGTEIIQEVYYDAALNEINLTRNDLEGINQTEFHNIFNDTSNVFLTNETNNLEIGANREPSEVRSGKSMRGTTNKKNHKSKSKKQENNSVKDSSDNNSDNSLSNLNESDVLRSRCGSNKNCDNFNLSSNLKSDSSVVGSKSEFNNNNTRNKKVKQVLSDDSVTKIKDRLNTFVNTSLIINSTYASVINDTGENSTDKISKYGTHTKNPTTTEPPAEEGAFYAIRTLAQGVLESVAERVVPSGILDLFRRMQNQSVALETERLRSKSENGGIGNWGRSIVRSVITDPLNNLMQGARDNGSLDSNSNFFSGVASGVASGVVYVADSVNEAFKDRVRAIFPGTLWCGDGDVARSDELGLFFLTDLCCKKHDTCKHYIRSGGTKFGLINTGVFSRSHCNCDKAFYRCLKKTNSIVSTQIGVTFFSILGPQCFKKDHPIVRCKRRTRITGQKCEEYEIDTRQPKMWQWFDSPTF